MFMRECGAFRYHYLHKLVVVVVDDNIHIKQIVSLAPLPLNGICGEEQSQVKSHMTGGRYHCRGSVSRQNTKSWDFD